MRAALRVIPSPQIGSNDAMNDWSGIHFARNSPELHDVPKPTLTSWYFDYLLTRQMPEIDLKGCPSKKVQFLSLVGIPSA